MKSEIELLIRVSSYGIIFLVGAILYKLALKVIDSEGIKNSISRKWALWYAIGNNLIPEYGGELDSNYEDKKSRTSILNNKCFQIVSCWFGLCISYLVWGLLQERLMTKTYDIVIGNSTIPTKFQDSDFIIFVNRIFSVIVGVIIIVIRHCFWKRNVYIRDQKREPPFYIFGYSSLSNLVSSFCQYESLKYISFPTQVVVKACKLVPVMIMNTIISREHYSRYQYLLAGFLCCGFGLFLYGNFSNKSESNIITSSTFVFAVWAILLPIGYLIFDSFTSTWQSKIFNDYPGTDSITAMTYSCIISSILSLGSITANREFSRILLLLRGSSQFRYHILGSGMASTVGQLMVYHTIAILGPIIFTLIMITRQIISVLLSSIIYRHRITLQSYIGIAIIFIVLICDKLYHMKNKLI